MTDIFQCYAKKHIASRGRECQFSFNAKKQPDGQWLVHMHADYVASVDTITNDAAMLFVAMEAEWEAEIS